MKQNELPNPVLQEYFEKGYKCAMESLQLSDEEIGLITTDAKWSHIETTLLYEFARAILKKAREK